MRDRPFNLIITQITCQINQNQHWLFQLFVLGTRWEDSPQWPLGLVGLPRIRSDWQVRRAVVCSALLPKPTDTTFSAEVLLYGRVIVYCNLVSFPQSCSEPLYIRISVATVKTAQIDRSPLEKPCLRWITSIKSSEWSKKCGCWCKSEVDVFSYVLLPKWTIGRD